MRKLTFSAPLELLDALSGVLFSAGAQGLQEGPGTLTAYVESPRQEQLLIAAAVGLNEEHGHKDEPISVLTQDIDDSWQDTWQQALTAVSVTERWVLRPTHQAPAPAGEDTIWFQPHASFGDGSHPTTQLAAAAIVAELVTRAQKPAPQMRLLDLGTGNGVLSLIALKEAALRNVSIARLLAIDIDEVAIQSLRQNLQLNDIDQDKLDVRLGGVSAADGSFEVIVANISTLVLLEVARELVARLAPSGVLLLTGLLVDDEPQIAACYRALGLALLSSQRKGDWSLLSLTHG
jgi:ribosomal protein L11 methyltransferase